MQRKGMENSQEYCPFIVWTESQKKEYYWMSVVELGGVHNLASATRIKWEIRQEWDIRKFEAENSKREG